jgi:AraC-like DNA-binding protein
MDYINMVLKSIEYLESNLKREVTIDEVIEDTYYSYPHFHRIFPDIVGDSIGGYIRKRKLSCAAEELVNSEKPICDIAQDYDFGSQQTFNRAFTNMFGLAPLQYRNKGMLDDIYKPFNLSNYESVDLMEFKVNIEALPPMKIASYQEYNKKISKKNPFADREKIVSKAWGNLVRWQMTYEYQKHYSKNAKIPNTLKLAEFFINNQLHVSPNTRYFGFNNPFPCEDNEFGYEAWASMNNIVENIDKEASIRIKDFSGGLYATTLASYGQDSNLDSMWRKLHLWLSSSCLYEYGEHQWLEEHITKANEGGFHFIKLYMAVKCKHMAYNEKDIEQHLL